MSIVDKLGGRKFVLTVLVEIFAFVALLLGKIDGEAFMVATGLITGLYGAANTLAKFSPEAEIWAEAETNNKEV